MFVFARRTTPLDYDADGIRRPDWRVRNIGWNEKGFAFADKIIDNLVAFPNPDLDVAFELIKIFFRVDLVKIVPGVWALNYHHKKITSVVEIAIADRRFEFVAVRFDPTFQ